MRRPLAILWTCALLALPASDSLRGQTDPTTQVGAGKIYFTTPGAPAGEPRIRVADFNYTGRIQLSNVRGLVTDISNARTIEWHPKDSNRLLVDGAGSLNVYSVHKATGAYETYTAKSTYTRLAVIEEHALLTCGNSSVSAFPILDQGLGESFRVRNGADFVVNPTQIIGTPAGHFFTLNAGTGPTPGGFGPFQLSSNYSQATSRLYYTQEPAARGGVYDPFSKTVILMSGKHVIQVALDLPDPGEPVQSEVPALSRIELDDYLPDVHLWQGAVDGKGRLYAASLSGHLFVLDFSRTRRVSSSRVSFVSVPLIHDVEVELGRPFETEDPPTQEP